MGHEETHVNSQNTFFVGRNCLVFLGLGLCLVATNPAIKRGREKEICLFAGWDRVELLLCIASALRLCKYVRSFFNWKPNAN